MIDFINLTNYRNISEPRKFELRPITILIGPNNSGKSSLIKALLLLKENKNNFEKLQFLNGPHKLGNFQTIISENANDDYIEFELPIFLLGKCKIKLQYIGSNDKINNGKLSKLVISRTNKEENQLLLIENITYESDTNLIQSFQCEINYIAFLSHFNLLSQEQKEFPHVPTFYEDFHFDKNYNKQMTNQFRFLDSSKTIYDTLYTQNENLVYSDSNSFETDKKYLSQLSERQYIEIDKYFPDYIIQSICKNIRYQMRELNFDTYGESKYYSFYAIKKLNSIKSINTTENGKVFFTDVIISIQEALLSIGFSLENLKYLSSASAIQERLYSDNKNSLFQTILSDFLETNGEDGINFLNIWMRKFDLIRENQIVEINRIAQSGYEILIKNTDSNKVKNIADCGFGVTQIVTLLIQFASRGEQQPDTNPMAPKGRGKQYLLEEPESNLHPALQSNLADLFTYLYNKNNLKFVIETHSEYMVRKFQYLVGKGELKSSDIIIHYFWKDGEEFKCKQIEINSKGGLSDVFEKGFYDESLLVQLELLKINSLN